MIYIDKKTMKSIEEAINSAIINKEDAMRKHENDPDQRSYEYYRGMIEGYNDALDIVKVIGS